ncbi:transcriptional regulator [Opitutaceae bacterium TAV5]|nr:transcriptional regulator [Opitutaceae bacterium TAV5]
MESTLTTSAATDAAPAASSFDWTTQLRDVVLDRSNGVPLHVQLRNSLRRLIELAPDEADKLTPENEMVELLGIAPGTVRKALDGLVAEGLIERRRALGTVIKRHTGASWLKTLAVILPNFPSHSNSAHLAALNRQMGILGGKMSIIPLGRGDDWKSCQDRLDFAPSEGGVVFFNNFSASTTTDLHASLQQQGYRSVHLGRPPEGCQCNSVSGSAEAFVRMGLERLAAAGHRRITFLVGEPEENLDVQERVRCFKEISRELGLAGSDVVHCGIHLWENASEAATGAIESIWNRSADKRPTALFAISDSTAMGALFGLARQSIRVPDDVSVLSWDGTELTRMVYPKLTSLATPLDKYAANVIALLSDKRARNKKILIHPEFREGDSIASPSSIPPDNVS